MNYINIKKLINQSIRHISEEIEKEFSTTDINSLLEKYKAKNIFELIEFLLCSNSDNCKNLNYKELITNLNEDLFKITFENQTLINKNKHLEFSNDKLLSKSKEIAELVTIQAKKISEIQLVIDKYNLILRNNNLDFSTEFKKVTPLNELQNMGLGL